MEGLGGTGSGLLIKKKYLHVQTARMNDPGCFFPVCWEEPKASSKESPLPPDHSQPCGSETEGRGVRDGLQGFSLISLPLQGQSFAPCASWSFLGN